MQPKNPSLQQVYRDELQPVLATVEVARIRLRNWILGCSAAVLPLLPLGWYLWAETGLIIAAVAAALLVAALIYRPMERYRSEFKQRVVQRLVQLYDPTLQYFPKDGLPEEVFRGSKLYTRDIDRYHCEDLMVGKVGATAFQFSEVHAEYKTHSDKQDHWHTIFQGILFIADFNKSFSGTTVVVPDDLEGLGGLGRMLQQVGGKLSGRPSELVKLEDPVFERMSTVYSTDQIEARYILSTSLMQRLVDFCERAQMQRNLKTGAIALSFIHSSVYIAISTTKNSFEPPAIFYGSALLSLSDMESYLADIQIAQDIVEDLNLNLRIWGKRG